MILRVLLALSGAEDTLFLQDVLTELEGREYWSDWVHLESLHASTWEQAESILRDETRPTDVLLLDLNLPVPDLPRPSVREIRRRDSHPGFQKINHGVEAFHRAQAVAPGVPVVLLVNSAEIAVAEHLLREGAQDFLVKSQIDCAPLAHAIRNSVERHRYLESARAASMTDPLTGLLNRAAFLALAERDRKLACVLGRRMLLAIAEPDDTDRTHKQQDRDLAMVETSERLRALAGPLDLVCRSGEREFAIAVFETAERGVDAAWSRLHELSIARHLKLGAAVLNPASPVALDELLAQARPEVAPVVAAARR